MSVEHERRLAAAAASMRARGIDAMFVMKPANLAYLSGDGRPCALGLLTATGRFIVAVPECDLPSVRAASAAHEVHGFRSEEEMFHGFRDRVAALGLEDPTIALEANFFDAALYQVFRDHILPQATVVSAAPVMSALRMHKDARELERLRAAARVADAGMAAAVAAVAVGTSETMVAAEAEYAMRTAGAEGWSAPTYVASGWRSAMAHGPASAKVIEPGDVVQVHVAPVVSGYTVDLCRTILSPDGDPDAHTDLAVYLEAQRAGIAAATPNAPLLGIDAAMTTVLEARGYADRFLRPTFHGVGMEHEEAPIPGGHAIVHGEQPVESVEVGMVLAIGNCGIYRERYGVRAEDTVAVGTDGPVRLTTFAENPRW